MATRLITLQVLLEEIDPPITRELQVEDDLTLADLHAALQIVFGWREQHLHLYRDTGRPGPGTRYWGDAHQLADRDLDGLRPESAVTIAEALADGPLWYEYDFGDGWTHRIDASAPATAIGDRPPVTLLGGRGRGPIEDSGGPRGYTEKLAVLADPDHPDHARLIEWAARVTGPWFPPAADSFDVEAIQAELDGWFAYRADERDPYDLSGLVLADDLRGPGDLRPDALLADFAAYLPAAIRSEFRQYVRRTGLLRPVRVDDRVREQLVAPFAWLLDAVGPDGLELSPAGRLPPAVVDEGMTVLNWHDTRTGNGDREERTLPIRTLREAATRLGLIRKLHGTLVRTAYGKRAATGTGELWDALTGRILEKLSPGAQLAATALLITYADGREQPETFDDERWREVAFALDVCGWVPGDKSASFDSWRINDIVAPVQGVVNSLGSTRGSTGWPPHRPDPHLADFACAVLHGPAAIRIGEAGRRR
ncbi:plasmid pRiA4b ORF-3 family protein [Gordonia caeni]|uniref:Plasmid pRiA4b Orf3-like domain-containing protein n=1 Tax=Gordonia caeni TaxID=1007097 RepID=A0ABP7PGR2_9ACTN